MSFNERKELSAYVSFQFPLISFNEDYLIQPFTSDVRAILINMPTFAVGYLLSRFM